VVCTTSKDEAVIGVLAVEVLAVAVLAVDVPAVTMEVPAVMDVACDSRAPGAAAAELGAVRLSENTPL
jgi:hypothetical protein